MISPLASSDTDLRLAPVVAADSTIRVNDGVFLLGSASALVAAYGVTADAPAWMMMWTLAFTLFALLKLATLRDERVAASPRRLLGYLTLWPGMDSRRFLAPRAAFAAPLEELAFAVGKTALGLALAGWAIRHAKDAPSYLVAWTGMVGVIFVLHFGVMHIASWLWRRGGVNAPPIMRAPIAATSLSELWGTRWNLAFADAARRFLLRPLSRRWGVHRAGVAVFVISGLVHELVLSVPARGGWGGPTLYFSLQAAGIAVEKSPLGRRLDLGHGMRGWLWVFVVAAVPVRLLFHPPFVERVIVPFFRTLNAYFVP
jgi:hypothetical protein